MACRAGIGACAVILGVAIVSGCVAPAASLQGQSRVKITPVPEAALRADLDNFYSEANTVIKAAADRIVAETSDSVIIRRAIVWKSSAVPAIRNAATKRDPRQGLLSAWVLSVAMNMYFAEGDGKALFGNLQPIAVNASAKVRQGVEGIAARVLPEEQFTTVRNAVEEFARANPFHSIVVQEVLQVSTAPPASLGPLGFVVGIPLSPFTAVSGISEGAAAIRDFTVVASRLNDIVADIPEETRWQVDLLLLDIEQLEAVAAALRDVNKAADGISQLAATAKQLPTDVDKMLQSTAPVMNVVERASSSLADAGRSWQGVIDAIDTTFGPLGRKSAETPPGPPRKPFDINDYANAAAQVDRAAVQLTALVAQTRETLESTAVDNRLNEVAARADATVARASASARGAVDHALWGLAALVGLAFFAAVVYRVITVYLIRPRKTG